MSLEDFARTELAELAAAGLVRVPRIVDGMQGPTIVLEGREVLNLGSNDYLSLAGDPRLARAAARVAEESGVGAGASRLIVGNHREHVALELVIVEWLRCGGVRLFNSGYAANVGVLTTLLRAGDVVFSDELNHASIIDGCRLSRAEVVVFPHRDLGALEAALCDRRGLRRVVVSESLFSMDGDVADVAALAALTQRHDASLVLDEAHALGVMGPEGRGVAAAAGVTPDLLIGTLGKALGSFGAFAATTSAVAQLLWNRARSLVFSTALPPMVAAAANAAIEIVRGREGDRRRAHVASHACAVRAAMRHSELRARVTGAAESPIVPVVIGDDAVTMKMAGQLFEAGVFAPGIRPPTVPVGTARIRMSLTADHQLHDLENACLILNDAMRRFT